MGVVRILVAGDHELVRRGLISILAASHPEWNVIADVPANSAAIETGAALRPDIAILDLFTPAFPGLEVAEQLLKSVTGIRIIVLSAYAAAPILHRLKRAGVHAYLARNEAPRMLVLAVERVLAGDPFFAPNSLPTMDTSEYIPVQFRLTRRELDVLRLLSRGKSNKEVASDLGLSVRTLESHRAHIFAKLHVKSLGELVRMAIRDGLT